MTKIKLCGLSRLCDIEAVNVLRPDYIGFVFAPGSRRRVSVQTAVELRQALLPGITAVGVFVDEEAENVAEFLNQGVIDMAQLHGHEDAAYVAKLRSLTDRKLIQAFRIRTEEDVRRACQSEADHVLLDSGAGTGRPFDWKLVRKANRPPYFLAGGLDPEHVGEAISVLAPYAVDVSSGIETDGLKDPEKMAAFVRAVREQ